MNQIEVLDRKKESEAGPSPAPQPLARRTLKVENLGDPGRGHTFSGIRLKGRWLTSAGFHPGHRVAVTVVSPGFMQLRILNESQAGGRPSTSISAGEHAASVGQHNLQPALLPLGTHHCSELSPDLKIVLRETIWLFYPLSEKAREWMAVHCPPDDDHQYFGGALVVEARYVEDLLRHAREDGLVM